MSRKYQTVATDILHIDWEIRNRLRSVYKKERIVTEFGLYFFHVVYFSGDVGNMSDGNYFHLIGIFFFEVVPIDLIRIINVEKFYFESFPLSQNLSWQNVRMMLSNSEENSISSFYDITNNK